MIVTDDPGANDSSNLTNYMSKEGHEIKNPAGNEMDETELNKFREKSERYGFTRHFVLAPERDDLTEDELDKAARKSMNEWSKDKDTLEYCYAVHNDEGNSHVHVAATASKDSGDLWIDTEQEHNEITRLRDDIAADHFHDHSLDRQQEQMQEQDREDELEQEQQEQQEQLMLAGSDNDQQDSHIDDAAIYAAAAGELASLSSPEMLPISIASEAWQERRREREQQQEQQRNRRRKR